MSVARVARPVRALRCGAGLALALVIQFAAGARAAPPPGFVDSLVAGPLGKVVALDFTPDGRLLVTTQDGFLWVIQDGALAGSPALELGPSVLCSDLTRGLLGVAVDPEFARNGHIYLFYTHRRPPPGDCSVKTANTPVNRVSRFTLSATNVVDPASEVVLLDGMPSFFSNHNGGDLLVGRDGLLYVTIGDGGCDYAMDSGCLGANDAARDLHVLAGKVLRIARDGSIPADNPFLGAGTARCHPAGMTAPGTVCQEIYATGLRNPFRFAADPNAAGTRVFVNDVGESAWEEIDLLAAGADYGWNCREGTHPQSAVGRCDPEPPALVDPVFEYPHGAPLDGASDADCQSITAGAFVPDGLWPGLDGAYLYTDSSCGAIWSLAEPPGGMLAAVFAGDEPPGKISFRFGPHGNGQALYYTTRAGGGAVRRIAYQGPAGNAAPVAALAVEPAHGPLPLLVQFDAAGSADADAGDALTYFWDLGDGGPVVRTTGAVTNHLFATPGARDVRLRVRDQHFAFSAPLAVRVYPGDESAPVPVIAAPAEGFAFGAAEPLVLQGAATDADEGALPDAALSWEVVRHLDGGEATWFGPVAGNGVPFQAPAPDDLDAVASTHLEVRLSATDAHGLRSTVARRLDPRIVRLRFESEPSGLRLEIAGEARTTPADIDSWDGWAFAVDAPSQAVGGTSWFLDAWDDGGGASRRVETPPAPASFTARFVAGGPWEFRPVGPCRLLDTREPEGPWGGPRLAARSSRRITVAGGARCGLPASPRALAVNVTVVAGSAGGILSAHPPGDAPVAGVPSTVAFRAGTTRASQAIVALAAGEFDLRLEADEPVDVVIDVAGWFAEPAAASD